jgi:hypothetical protein
MDTNVKRKKESGNKPDRENEESYLMNLERFLKGLSDDERKKYETCMSLLQSIGEEGGLEDACEWLEKKASRKATGQA